MPTFVALLRGVNVGKARRVPMANLRSLLGAMGHTGVATLRNSGNAVFHASRRAPARHATDHSRLLVAFTQDARALQGLAGIGSLVTPPEQFVVGRNAAYLHCPQGILGSKAGEALLGKAGKAATTRNWATTLKLGALVLSDRDQRWEVKA
ncbi:MAG: DUF1697 domain-containing protein [Steroidobacteraceae bacterium]